MVVFKFLWDEMGMDIVDHDGPAKPNISMTSWLIYLSYDSVQDKFSSASEKFKKFKGRGTHKHFCPKL